MIQKKNKNKVDMNKDNRQLERAHPDFTFKSSV